MLHVRRTTLACFRSSLPATRSIRYPTIRSIETQAADRLVVQGIMAARAGRRSEALHLFDQALRINADHLEALLWRGGLSEPDESLLYLKRAYAIAPGNRRVQEGLEWAQRRAAFVTQDHTLQQGSFDSPVADLLSIPPVHTTNTILTTLPTDEQATTPCQTRKQNISDRLVNVLFFLAQRPLPILLTTIMLLIALGTASLGQNGFGYKDISLLPTLEAISPTPSSQTATPISVEPTISPTVTVTPSPTPTGPSALDLAWSAEDWPQVITLVEEMLKDKPGDAELTEKLFAAHFNYGVQLVRTERLTEAVAEFDQALLISVGDIRAESERMRAQLYLEGSAALAMGNFAAAIAPLRTLYESNPGYGSVKTKLYQAYIGYAAALEESGKKTDAYLNYEKAVKIDPQGAEALAGLARLKPPTPMPKPAQSTVSKKIEVDIAKQQVIVWENGKVLWRFKASTGKAPYSTRTGHFKIQSKMPNAYSSAMQWGMPWWMGIYYAGKWENGFHAMARVGKEQRVLPESVLGRPATHGCIMLSDRDAKTLYDWAEIGTPVWIH